MVKTYRRASRPADRELASFKKHVIIVSRARMLYTKKGDNGTTKFFDTKSGERVCKTSPRAECLGCLDELNSFLGLCKVKCGEARLALPDGELFKDAIDGAQQNLFIVQAEVAGAEKTIAKSKVEAAEIVIDALEKAMPPITSFTVAGGSQCSALLDIARTIARKTERRVIEIHDSGERKIGEHTRQYMNRLSSLLFALARYANLSKGIAEKGPLYK